MIHKPFTMYLIASYFLGHLFNPKNSGKRGLVPLSLIIVSALVAHQAEDSNLWMGDLSVVLFLRICRMP